MKCEITEKGVYGADGQPIKVGATIDVKGDTVPAWLINKCRPVGGGKTAVTNPENGGEPKTHDTPAKTPAEVLAMFSDKDVQFMTARAEAAKLMGDATPGKKAEIVAALEELATKPE